MCGKFTAQATWRQVVDFSAPLAAGIRESVVYRPMMMVPVIVHDREAGRRRVVPMRWGFPHRGNPNRPDPIHARAETIDEKPTFKAAFENGQRGIVAVQTFNSGKDLPSGKVEQWVVDPADNQAHGIAFVWRRFEIEGQPAPLLACAMVTVPPNGLIRSITDRMPAVLEAPDWPVWLGETAASPAEAKAVLKVPAGTDWRMAPEKQPSQPSFL